ncbi:hypothetical protein BMS3Abin17_00715 [archaeon BMS3Abin17]|nr:hypothetical protein BMS3Abin17_00715 [archaeon BMS3Abin17]HDZ61032.1 hypothetical protein [Candidatus Pacearchaeota archaeon]
MKTKKGNVKKKKAKKEEVCEIFEVGKEDREETIRVCGTVDSRPATKEEIEGQNKLLRNVLIGIGLFALIFVISYIAIGSMKSFEYKGVEFNIVNEGDLILYQTSVPVNYNGEVVPYNFYLRKDPRILGDIDFKGELILSEDAVINMTEEFNCDGDEVIAIANLVKLYGLFGVNTIRDDNATCDSEGRYMFIRILPGSKTAIEKTGPVCYDLNVNNCEILDVTERMMLELFIRVNKINGSGQ